MASPLEEFKSNNIQRWDVLQDLPPWEQETVSNWLKNIFVEEASTFNGRDKFKYSICRTIETENRLMIHEDLGINCGSWSSINASYWELVGAEDFRKLLIFIECVVKYVRDGRGSLITFYSTKISREQALMFLDISLGHGSKWKVVHEKYADNGLEARVDTNLTGIAAELKLNDLTEAWNAAFAVKPDPQRAIEYAQNAIEHVASEHKLTAAKTSVYGNLLGDIKNHPENYVSVASGAFSLMEQIAMDPKNPVKYDDQFSGWVAGAMELIQKSNPARHKSELTKNFVLEPAVGQQAVLMATVLCQLIASGSFIRRQKS